VIVSRVPVPIDCGFDGPVNLDRLTPAVGKAGGLLAAKAEYHTDARKTALRVLWETEWLGKATNDKVHPYSL
jgi:hypothetical protein